jgi:hypothetical protein
MQNANEASRKGTPMESTMKPPFPEVAPVIEIFPGVHATLMADWSRYSNGTFGIGGYEMTAGGKDGKPVGNIGCDGGGRWTFTIGEASYEVNMREAFESVMAAHIASL